MALFELRQYKIRPGKMDAWLKLMQEEVMPFQVSKGAVITAMFQGESDDSLFFWIRRFENEEERARIWPEIYESDYWKSSIAPRLDELRDRSAMKVQRVVPTKMSPSQ